MNGYRLEIRTSNGTGADSELRANRIWNIIETDDTIGGTVPTPLGFTFKAAKMGVQQRIVQVRVKTADE